MFSCSADPTGPGPCAIILTGISALLIVLTLPLSLVFCVKVITARQPLNSPTLIGNYLIDQTPSQNNVNFLTYLGRFLSVLLLIVPRGSACLTFYNRGDF